MWYRPPTLHRGGPLNVVSPSHAPPWWTLDVVSPSASPPRWERCHRKLSRSPGVTLENTLEKYPPSAISGPFKALSPWGWESPNSGSRGFLGPFWGLLEGFPGLSWPFLPPDIETTRDTWSYPEIAAPQALPVPTPLSHAPGAPETCLFKSPVLRLDVVRDRRPSLPVSPRANPYLMLPEAPELFPGIYRGESGEP